MKNTLAKLILISAIAHISNGLCSELISMDIGGQSRLIEIPLDKSARELYDIVRDKMEIPVDQEFMLSIKGQNIDINDLGFNTNLVKKAGRLNFIPKSRSKTSSPGLEACIARVAELEAELARARAVIL